MKKEKPQRKTGEKKNKPKTEKKAKPKSEDDGWTTVETKKH